MRWNGSGLALSSIAVLVIAGVAISIYSSENTGKETFTVSFRDDFGGKAFRGNTVCPINYTITGGTPNYTVELFYRFGGAGWVAIGYDNRTESGNYSYNWITPWATSTEVQLKITVTDSTLTTKYAESTRFEIDSTAPGEVTDLIATNATKTSIELQWSAPGDDGTSGSASSYDIRYNTLEITEANWNSSIQCTGEPTPTVGGTLQKFTVGELTPGTKYYFALKSKDNVGWESNISNIATAHTLVEVTLNSPVGGEAWKGDTSYTIQYSIAGTEAPFTVKLYYAYNDTSFIFIGYDNRTAAGECSYNWTTPEILSVSARVKINVTDNTSLSDEKVSGEFEIDSTPPGKVNDLSVSSVTYNSITLTWSAPGEDGEVCNITHTKDEDNLTIPDGVGNVTSNLSVPENIMIGYIRVYLRINHTYVMNLVVKLSHPDGTTVTLFNHTGGSDDNIWGWYEDNTFTSEPGSSFNLIPSESISALKTKGSQGIWKLYVADTSAGQTGAIDYWKLEIKAGKVISYELRYNSTSEITEANWENSTLCANIILPSVPGTIEKFEVTGLSPGIKYHIGVRSTDNVGWQSVLSNVVNSTTPLYVEVLTPNGNQCWSGESNHKIEYKFLGSRPSDKVYDHYIYYVYNGNVEFLVHYYSEANGTFEVSWTTTKIDSTKVKVRVNITVEGYSYGEDESDSNFTIDSTPPTVINATSNVSILPDTPIIIEFSEPMNRSSVESAFSSSPLFASISWAWNANFTIATISHADFTTGTYNCKINTSAKDVSDPGNSLPQNYTFSFKVVYPLEVYVMYPNGGEVWNGSLNWNIVYTISGGSPPYNVSLYWVNGSVEGYIATESRSLAGSHAYQWVAPGITNNTLKIKVEVVDNTTPKQLKSDLSDEVFEIDSTPPGKALLKDFGPNLILEPDIIAKEGYPRAHAVKIKWLAPGDDGDIGKVKYYHIKYSNNSIDDNSWGNIISYINYTARVSAGEWESCVIEGLQENNIYWFALKAYDNVGFVSELSNCICIKTLDYYVWDDSLEPSPDYYWDPANKTVVIVQFKEIKYTEIRLRGNLYVKNDATFKLTKVLFVIECTGTEPYSIQVAPGPEWLRGGVFWVVYSNVTALYPQYPYLFKAWPNSAFWLDYSSMNYCSGNISNIGEGIEIDSSDVWIANSTITHSKGIFIRDSLPRQAQPKIIDSELRDNVYGVVIIPRIALSQQLPLNLINTRICNSEEAGLYADGAKVGLDSCWFIENTHGVIYNNIPLDLPPDPYNVSGRVYHCKFESNAYAITVKNSFLKAIATWFTNNTHLTNADIQRSTFHSAIYLENSSVEFVDNCKFANNAYSKFDRLNITDPLISTICCKNSTLNIANSNFSNNNGIDFNEVNIWNYIVAEQSVSTLLEGLTTTLHFELSNVTITNSNFTDNGYPFSAVSSFYIMSFTAELVGASEEERIPIKERISGEYPVSNLLGMPIHYSLISGYSTELNLLSITDSDFYRNLQGILCIGMPVVFNNNTVDFTPWSGSPLYYEGTVNYWLVCANSPLTLRNNQISNYFVGVTWILTPEGANICSNTFTHNVVALFTVGTADVPETIVIPTLRNITGIAEAHEITIPRIVRLFIATLERINVVAEIGDNKINDTFIGLFGIGAMLTLKNDLFACTFDVLSALSKELTISNCTFEGTIGIISLSSTISVTESPFNLPVGIVGIDSKIDVSKSQFLTMIALYLVGETTAADVRDSFLHGGLVYWGVPYWGACTLEEHPALNLNNVTICGDLGILSGWYEEVEGKELVIFGGTIHISNSRLIDIDCGVACTRGSESTVRIDNTVFSVSVTGILAYDSDITATETTFEGGYRGIQYQLWRPGIKEWNLNLDNNDFLNITAGRAVSISGVPGNLARIAIEKNTFSNCLDGIEVSCSVGKIKSNTITNGDTGLDISLSELEVSDNRFERMTGRGIYAFGLTSKARIYKNIFYLCGIGLAICECSCSIVENEIDHSSIGLSVEGGASEIIGNNISYSSSYGIFIAEWSGTEPRIMCNNITNNNYGIYVTLTKGMYTKSNTISFNYYGLYVGKSWANTILELCDDRIFNNTECGIYMIADQTSVVPKQQISATNANIWNNSIGLRLQACAPILSNTTIRDNTLYDVVLLINAKLKCINTTLSTLNITHITGELELYCYLTISVKWQTGMPVENATVSIYSKYGVEVFRALTNREGICNAELLASYINHSSNRSYLPYSVNATLYVVSSNQTVEFDLPNKTKFLKVWNATGYYREVSYLVTFLEYYSTTLYDTTAPTISPEPLLFTITNNASLKISGTAWDNIGIYNWSSGEGIQIRINDGSWCGLINYEAKMKKFELAAGRIVNSTIEWSGIVNLIEGMNWIELRVVDETHDFINNTGNAILSIVLDTTPPTIVKSEPKMPDVKIIGENIDEGYNFSTPSTVSVSRAAIKLKFLINGSAEENVTIRVNQDNYHRRLNETGKAWVITDNISLTWGYNTITIIVSDELGNGLNITYLIKLLVVDESAPLSVITYPFKEHVNSILIITGFAEDDISGISKVQIRIYNATGNTNWNAATKTWSATEIWLNISLGGERYEQWSLNTAKVTWLDGCVYVIYVKALDCAGNIEKERFKVFTYDTTKPFIHIPIQDGYRTTENYLSISGKTERGAIVIINGVTVVVDEFGNFNFEIQLGEGYNTITIVAYDTAGNVNELTITVEKYKEAPFVTPTMIMFVWIAAGALLAGIIAVIIASGGIKIKPKIKVPKAKPPPAVAPKLSERPAEKPPAPERRYF